MCLSAAVNLLEGKMCFQNLPLALSYYRKHLEAEGAARHQGLEALVADMSIIDRVEARFRHKHYAWANAKLQPIAHKNYACVSRMLGMISESRGEEELASTYYRNAGYLGDGESMYRYAERLLQGKEDAILENAGQRNSEAYEYYQYAAAYLGYHNSGIRLAECYKEGMGVEKDYHQALDIYEQLKAYGDDSLDSEIANLTDIIAQGVKQQAPLPMSSAKILFGDVPEAGPAYDTSKVQQLGGEEAIVASSVLGSVNGDRKRNVSSMIAESPRFFQHSAKKLSFDEPEQTGPAADSYHGVEPLFDENSPPRVASPANRQPPNGPSRPKKLF